MQLDTAPLRVEALTAAADLTAHEHAWWALAREAPGPSPLRTPTWFLAHLEHKLAPGQRWRVMLAYDGPRLAGVLPVVEVAPRTLGLRRARWRVPDEYAAESGDPLLARGLESQTLDALCRGLAHSAPGCLGVEIGRVRDESATARAVPRRAPDGVGSEIAVSGTAEAWLRAISENLRVNMRKAANRLERERPGAMRTEFLAGADATPGLLDEFAALEDRGWKGADGGALARAPAKLALYRTLIAGWARAGVLEWHVLRLEGRAVAMHMAVRLGRTLGLLRICYDETLGKHMPGNLLIKAMAEREHTDGRADAIDFLQSQTWNQAWRMRPVPYGAAFVPARGLAAALLGNLPAQLKQLAHATRAAWHEARAD
jgi:CelD/BcsL family acetyltransferase involved in cellulose biosynthesis